MAVEKSRVAICRLRPCLEDLRVDFRLLTETSGLGADEFYAFMQITRFDATVRVWTYDEPRPDGGMRMDFARFHGLMGCRSEKHWRSVLESLLRQRLVRVEDGRIFPSERYVTIAQAHQGTLRPPIPASVRSLVMKRDNWTCSYCGTTNGPFDLDHVVPFSRGGAHTDPENLTCACGPCNNAKRARTPEEWISGGDMR